MATTPNRSWPTPDDTDLVRDGAAAIRALADAIDGSVGQGFVYAGTRYYTSSGQFEKADPFGDGNPTGLVVRAVRVRVQGGGGGGAGAEATGAGQSSAGAGGSGGAYAESFLSADVLSASETVTRGGGGPGGVGGGGTDGATSRFGSGGSLVEAAGGIRGLNRTAGSGLRAAVPGDPTTAGVGDLVVAGGSGGAGLGSPDEGIGGSGGASHLGGGGRALTSPTGATNNQGANYGGGGAGVANSASSATKNGGAGAPGIVILDIFV